MENKLSRSVLFATTALSLGLTGQAVAQESGDIVVTARRIEERLQDVPISITVFNQEQIDDRNITDVVSLASYTPSLSTQNQFGANNAQFAIRGFVQDPFTAPSVGVYFADVIAPRGASSFQSGDGAGPGSFFDLQNVQVLKGPQGTLFGRNTTGGSILLVPQKPGYEFEGYLEGSVGNYDMRRVQGVVNIPLGDQARMRLGVDHQTRDGYIDNVGSPGPSDFGDVDYTALRGSFVIDLAPNLENYTILTYANSDTNGNLLVPIACDTTPPIASFAGLCQGQLATLNTLAPDNFYRGMSLVDNPSNELDQWQFINTTTWDINDNLTFKNIMSYQEIRNDLRSSVFGLTWDANGPPAGGLIMPVMAVAIPGGAVNHTSTFTEEIQFQGSGFDSRLTWQAGAYYEAVEQIPDRVGTLQGGFAYCEEEGYYLVPNPNYNGVTLDQPQFIPNPAAQCTDPLAASSASSLSSEVRTSAFYDAAVYAQGTYEVTDRFEVTLGLRYTDDQTEGTTEAFTYYYGSSPSTSPTPIGLPSAPTAPAQPFAVVCSDPSAGFAVNGCSRSVSQHSNATTGELVFGYDLTDSWNTYLKYARGYRQGMVNPRGFGFLGSFGQEQIDMVELGFKGNWRGDTPGYVNIAIYQSLLQGQQLNASYTGVFSSIASGVVSVGKTQVDGIEIDGSISLFEGFRLTGGLGWMMSDLKQGAAPLCLAGWNGSDATCSNNTIPGQNLSNGPDANRDLPFSPEWKYSITPSYTLPLSEEIGEISLAATWTWTSDYIGGSGFAKIDSAGTLNLNVNWDRVLGAPVDLSLFGTNVLDEEYYTTSGDLTGSSLGVQYANRGEPRMVGARLRYSFGAAAE